jgi:hypothetical protein
MTYIKIVVCLSFMLSCKAQKGEIIPLPMMKEIDTLKHDGIVSTYRTDYYLVRGKSKDIKRQTWSYISKNIDSSLLLFNQYDMKFYKESENLNLDIIANYNEKYKAFIDEKPVVIYSWFNGRVISY